MKQKAKDILVAIALFMSFVTLFMAAGTADYHQEQQTREANEYNDSVHADFVYENGSY